VKATETITLAVAALAACASITAAVIAARTARKASETTSAATRLAPMETARHNAQRSAYAAVLTALYAYLGATRRVLESAAELERSGEDELDERPWTEEALRVRRARIDDANLPDPVRLALAVVRLEGPGEIADQAERVETGLERLVTAFSRSGIVNRDEGETQNEGTCAERHQALGNLTYTFTNKASAYLNSNPAQQINSA
jgi:hypothetical protein